MHDSNGDGFFAVVMLCVLLIVLATWLSSVRRIADAIRSTSPGPTWQEAIDHGHAHYDSMTGKFEWNTPAECGKNEGQGE